MRCMDTSEHEAGEQHSIMLRAKLTDSEWAEIRKGAIDARMNASDFVGDLLRRGMAARKADPAAA
jgi:hypothetical protein